ncbi:putative transcriptional regulatory protein C2H10.01 [Cercospora zeina]
MMTQSYYAGDFDSLARSPYRAPVSSGHYGRHGAYGHGYYEPHHELRSDFAGRSGPTASIHEHNPENTLPGHSRRRIQVACSRCRRRKIKCTGDPGDGSGCSACRSAQADKASCTFNRVGSRDMPLSGLEVIPTSSTSIPNATPTTTSYPMDASSTLYNGGSGTPIAVQRPSLPVLHTRTAYPDYDSYNTSPVDDYTYASSTVPRHESFAGAYSTESFRPYTSGSMSAPSGSANLYYEPAAAYSFGNLHTAPGYQASAPTARLPSVTADAFSSLNMSSLHSSLPTQTVQERRLPVPYAPQQATYPSTEVPHIRPLTSLTEPQRRAHIGGIYSRNSMSWSMASPGASRASSISGIAASAPHGLPAMSSSTADSAQTPAPILGYQFSASSTSPEPSPINGLPISESFSSSASNSGSATVSMLPPANIRYGARSSTNSLSALGDVGDSRRLSTSQEAPTSLYSFSGGIEASGRSTPTRHTNHIANEPSSSNAYQQGYAQLRHPQPQHAASVDELRRRSSNDQQHHATTAHRMSVSNLNARY